MAKVVKKRPCDWLDDDLKVDELGAETESEKQMQKILEKQLNTKLTLSEQFSQHKTFVTPSTYQSPSDLISGAISSKKFKEIEESQELEQELQRCGLSAQEITDYIQFKSGKASESRLVNPSVWHERMGAIQEKIRLHEESLCKPQSFVPAKKLTRHEMEVEQSLYAGCEHKSQWAALLTTADNGGTDVYTDDAFLHIKELSTKLLQKCRKKKKNNKQINNQPTQTIPAISYDANIHHVVVPLAENEVSENRLTVEEIRSIPRFENYEPGEPNKVLFVKNLHPKSTVHELRSVLGILEEENGEPIHLKLCTGRMKGQAFVTFSNSDLASRALLHMNGYKLNGKPMIVQFGKKT